MSGDEHHSPAMQISWNDDANGNDSSSAEDSYSPMYTSLQNTKVSTKKRKSTLFPTHATRSEFLHHSLSLYALQILREAGFTRVSKNALAILTHVVQCFIEEIGRRSKQFAEASGRQYTNFYDVITVLNEFNQPLSTLIRYIMKSDSLPFLYHIDTFPRPSSHSISHLPPTVISDLASSSSNSPGSISTSTSDTSASSSDTTSSNTVSSTASSSDIRSLVYSSSSSDSTYYPPFLPPFPPLHTYTKTTTYPEQPVSSLPPPLYSRMKKLALRRAVESSLIRFRAASEEVDKLKETGESVIDKIITPAIADSIQTSSSFITSSSSTLPITTSATSTSTLATAPKTAILSSASKDTDGDVKMET